MSQISDTEFNRLWKRYGELATNPPLERAVAYKWWTMALEWSRPLAAEKIILLNNIIKQLKSRKPSRSKSQENPISVFVLPEWIPAKVWAAFEEWRKRNRWLLTDYARRLIVRRLEKFRKLGQDPVACIEQSIERGWRGVFAVRDDAAPEFGIEPKRDQTPAGKKLIEQYKRENAKGGNGSATTSTH